MGRVGVVHRRPAAASGWCTTVRPRRRRRARRAPRARGETGEHAVVVQEAQHQEEAEQHEVGDLRREQLPAEDRGAPQPLVHCEHPDHGQAERQDRRLAHGLQEERAEQEEPEEHAQVPERAGEPRGLPRRSGGVRDRQDPRQWLPPFDGGVRARVRQPGDAHGRERDAGEHPQRDEDAPEPVPEDDGRPAPIEGSGEQAAAHEEHRRHGGDEVRDRGPTVRVPYDDARDRDRTHRIEKPVAVGATRRGRRRSRCQGLRRRLSGGRRRHPHLFRHVIVRPVCGVGQASVNSTPGPVTCVTRRGKGETTPLRAPPRARSR